MPAHPSSASQAPPPLDLSGAHATREGAIRRSRRSRARRRLAFVALAFVTAAIVAIVLSGVTNQTGVVRDAAPGGRSVVLTRLTLAPTNAQPTAGGTAAVMRSGQKLVLLIQAHGLAPNGQDVYAVWLNTPGGAHDLLGLVSPPVGRAGTFSSGTPLPGGALRFADLLVTREATIRPVQPGPVILASPLKPR